jgi:hypothetical protein
MGCPAGQRLVLGTIESGKPCASPRKSNAGAGASAAAVIGAPARGPVRGLRSERGRRGGVVLARSGAAGASARGALADCDRRSMRSRRESKTRCVA